MKSKQKSVDSKISKAIQRAFRSRLETKVNILNVSPTAISAAGAVYNLSNAIVQGDDYNNRTGDMITSVGSTLNFRFRAIGTDQTARFIVVRDDINTGVTPAVTDILETPIYRSEFNARTTIQQKRFKVLMDAYIDSNLNGETLKTVTKTISPHGKTFYNGGTAVVASNGKGSLFLLVIGDASTGLLEFTWQQRFVDA